MRLPPFFIRRLGMGFRNAPLPPMLVTNAKLIERDGRHIWRVIYCPQCGERHEHDVGRFGVDDPRRNLYFAMPCASRTSRWDYYQLREVQFPGSKL